MGKGSTGAIWITFLIYPCEEDSGQYVSHCLEFDVVAVGGTKPKAIELLKELIDDLLAAAIQDGTLAKVFNPAPIKYWRMLAEAKPYRPPARIIARHIEAKPVQRVSYAVANC